MTGARTLRVGHKGADLIAPGNTAASFEAALACGVDMIEFDVLPMYPDGEGELYLAHDYTDLRARRDGGSLLTLARVDSGAVEGWREEGRQAIGAIHQQRVDGRHGQCRALGVCGTGEHGP